MIVQVKMSTEIPRAKNEKIWQKEKHKDREYFVVNMKDKLINFNEKSTSKIRLKK